MATDLPASILERCREILGTEIQSVFSVSGGDINQARQLKTSKGDYFLKMNAGEDAARMFATEARGLALLAETKALRTPEVIAHGQTEEGAFLLLEHIETGYRPPEFWKDFGRGLAVLHANAADHFGLDHDNFIGSLPQSNGRHDTWPEFYIRERLQPQVKMAIDAGQLTTADERMLQQLYKRLGNICPAEPPALVHGDLWSGNFLVAKGGSPVIIDPSVSYAHREMDLAMSRLFGGFDRAFYRHYEEAWPLEMGFEQRLPVYQLYYLLVHVNLFGGGYLSSVREVLRYY